MASGWPSTNSFTQVSSCFALSATIPAFFGVTFVLWKSKSIWVTTLAA